MRRFHFNQFRTANKVRANVAARDSDLSHRGHDGAVFNIRRVHVVHLQRPENHPREIFAEIPAETPEEHVGQLFGQGSSFVLAAISFLLREARTAGGRPHSLRDRDGGLDLSDVAVELHYHQQRAAFAVLHRQKQEISVHQHRREDELGSDCRLAGPPAAVHR